MSLVSKKFRVFMTIAHCGSVSQAASLLSLTVSPVSRMLGEFEHTYGMRLFDRSGNGLVLTEEGVAVYQDLQPIWELLCQAEQKLKPRGVKHTKVLHFWHDWGNDVLLYHLHESLMSNQRRIVMKSLHPQNDISTVTQGNNNLLFLSRALNQKGLSLLAKIKIGRLAFISNQANSSSDTLIVAEEQMDNPVFKSMVSKLMNTGVIRHVMGVGSIGILHELVAKGRGKGMAPDNFNHFMSWRDFVFEPFTDTLSSSLDTYVYSSSFNDLDIDINQKLQQALAKM